MVADATIGAVIFVDYLGPTEWFDRARTAATHVVSKALRVPTDQVVVRRIATEGGGPDMEVWVELSTEEQLYRIGAPVAEKIAAGIRAEEGEDAPNVWVMYRVVPRSHAFRNGEPRARGQRTFE